MLRLISRCFCCSSEIDSEPTTQTNGSISTDPEPTTQTKVSLSTDPVSTTQTKVSLSTDPVLNTQTNVSADPEPTTLTKVSLSTDPVSTTQSKVSLSVNTALPTETNELTPTTQTNVPPSSRPAQVIFIRHGEKEEDGSKGALLNEQGLARADALVDYFQKDPKTMTFGPPAAIFAVTPNPGKSTHRTIQTVAPLADRLKMKVLTPYGKDQIEDIARDINSPVYSGKTVLVCWSHRNINPIIEKLGAESPHYPDGRFDLVYRATYNDECLSPSVEVTQQDIPGIDSVQMPQETSA